VMDPDDGTARLVKVVVELVYETVCRGHSASVCCTWRDQLARRVAFVGRSGGQELVMHRRSSGKTLMSTFMSL